jgi:hypothetical protein
MEVTVRTRYPQSPEEVLARFLQSDYIKQKYEAAGAVNVSVLQNSQQGSLHRTIVERDVNSEVPGFARNFFKARNTVLETDDWSMSCGAIKKCRYTAEVQGAPVKINGTITLRPGKESHSCEHEVTCKIAVKIPLIGKKIAKLVAKQTEDNLAQEFAFNSKIFQPKGSN